MADAKEAKEVVARAEAAVARADAEVQDAQAAAARHPAYVPMYTAAQQMYTSAQHMYLSALETLRTAMHRSDGSGVNWTEVFKLSSEEEEFLDRFLSNEYSLDEMDTGVARVPLYGDVPSMLLFDLGRREFTHADLLEEALTADHRTVLVAGTSGCGKTKSVYDLFSRTDGFYFVVSTENGGSDDMSEMIDGLKPLLVLGDKSRANRDLVAVFTRILLACRMVIYQHMKMKGADSRQWMLLQAACRKIGPGKDVFKHFFQRVRESLPGDRNGILKELDKLWRVVTNLSARSPVPTVAIDEAQVAMQEMSDSYFWSESHSCWVPLLNPLVHSLQVTPSFEHKVVVTGTGDTLRFKWEVGGSGEKMVGPVRVFTSFSGWDSPEHMVKFAERVVKLSEDDLSLLSSETWGIFPRFRGRFRPFCDVLQCMMAKDMSLAQASEYVIAAQTTKDGKPEFPKSFYCKIEQLSMTGDGFFLVAELVKAVVSYFGQGRGWSVSDELLVPALESGIARMLTDKGAAEIEEYLILLAARNFFEDKHAEGNNAKVDYLPTQLLKGVLELPYPSAQGFCYQNYVAAAFEAMWKKGSGRMDSMPLFRPLLVSKDCPAEFRELAKLEGNLKEGLISIFVRSDRYTLEMYLSDLQQGRQMCSAYVVEEKYGVADEVRAAEFQVPEKGPVLMHMFGHQKLKKDPLSAKQVTEALEKSGINMPHLMRYLSPIRLQILYICPQSRKKFPAAFWKGPVGTIIVDNANASQVFGTQASKCLELYMRWSEVNGQRFLAKTTSETKKRKRKRTSKLPKEIHHRSNPTP